MQLVSKVTEIRDKELVCTSLVSVGNPAEGRRSQTSWTPDKLLIWYGTVWELESIFYIKRRIQSSTSPFLIHRIGIFNI